MLNANKATSYMTTPVITIGQFDTLEAAINLMIEESITCLPIVDRMDHLVGILTEGDILRCTSCSVLAPPSHWLSRILGSAAAPRRISRKVRDVMTRRALSAATNTTPEWIIDLMRNNGIQHVPVIEQGQLVGLISRSAMLDTFANEAVSANNIFADRSVARERWTRLNAMHDDVVELCGKVNQSIEKPRDLHQFSSP